MITAGAAGALSGLALDGSAQVTEAAQKDATALQFPKHVASDRAPIAEGKMIDGYDMRNDLNPRRLTTAMWDTAYLLRHGKGGSMADFDRVLTRVQMCHVFDFATVGQTIAGDFDISSTRQGLEVTEH